MLIAGLQENDLKTKIFKSFLILICHTLKAYANMRLFVCTAEHLEEL
jgi:hypothetical protein